MAQAAQALAWQQDIPVRYRTREDEDRIDALLREWDGEEDPDFPGCAPVPMTVEQFRSYDGRVEYWSRDRGMAWILRDASPDHESAGSILPALITRMSMERGSTIRCWGALRMVVCDRFSQLSEGMHPDQSIYLRPERWTPSGRETVIGEDPPPDIVLETDHTTDVRRKKLGVYRRWRVPELWVETPDAPTPSRPRGLAVGLSIYVLQGKRYVQKTESAALPSWRADQIHRALNEPTPSAQTIEDVMRVGRLLGDSDGTGPMDDVQIAGYMRRAHEVGQQAGYGDGHRAGLSEGRAEGQAEGLADAAAAILRLRGIVMAEDFDERLASMRLPSDVLLDAAQRCSTEADFWARLG